MLNNRLITLFACLAGAPRVACTCGHSRQQQVQDAGEHINCPQCHSLLLSLLPIPISLLELHSSSQAFSLHSRDIKDFCLLSSSLLLKGFPCWECCWFSQPLGTINGDLLGTRRDFSSGGHLAWGDGWAGTALSPPGQSGKR